MPNLIKVNQLLDDYLYGRIPREKMGAIYKEQLQPVYNELSFRPKPINFYESDQLRGNIAEKGTVEFVRKYPEIGIESYASPQEMLAEYGSSMPADKVSILQNYKTPTRDLIRLNKSFQDYSNSPEGARLYSNTPYSPHRGKAYEKMGFQGNGVQYLDKRPYADQEDFNKLYLIGDINSYGLSDAEVNLGQRIERSRLSSGSRVANLQNEMPVITQKLIDTIPNLLMSADDYW